ncbi:hypothetical protein Sango_1482500 [Sesamum angolense]|uniref:Uncharacterized protein n=1 Tax=Sesamum angolense TaxID=2727404 RepID=A0AAE1WN78_9LAMI|nr:hypothetical protein Sango_1482500 [Sesamum angolense]
MRFLTQGTTPDNPKETRALRVKATHFVLLDGELYKRGFSQPLLKYLTPEEGNYVLREIHEEICGNHLGGRDLAGKVVKQGRKIKNGAKGWRSNSSSPQSAIRKQTIKPRSPTEQSPTLEDEPPMCRALRTNLDFLDEVRKIASARATMYKSRGQGIKCESYAEKLPSGDLVMRKAEASVMGKLDPKWEGPYKNVEIVNEGGGGLTSYNIWKARSFPARGTSRTSRSTTLKFMK